MANITNAQGKKLREYIERVERLREQVKELTGDINDIFAEAKGIGFDVKTMKKVIMMRRLSRQEREEESTILDVYLGALGMLDTPLSDWADEQERERPIGGNVIAL